MPGRTEFQTAFAICAAIIGAGFASGREIVGFFSGMGSASWLGVITASGGIAGLTYVLLRLSGRVRAHSFPALYGALMGSSCRDAVALLHGLMCLVTASAMLSAGSELGALAFPWRYARAAGFLLTLLPALAASVSGLRPLAMLGMLLAPLILIYYLCMGQNVSYPVGFSPRLLPASLAMGCLYAAFNAALAGGTICLSAKDCSISAGRTAFLTGGMMFLLLSAANRTLLRAGDAVRQTAMPAVVLAAHWGASGYYISILVIWLSVLTTLCAMLHSLAAQFTQLHAPRIAKLTACAAAASLLSVCGFRLLVDTLYPILGWVCSFVLLALIAFLPEENTKKSPSSLSWENRDE